MPDVSAKSAANARDVGQNSRDVEQNAREEKSNDQWRLSFVLDTVVSRLDKMAEIQDRIVDRLNGDQGLSARVQRVEDKADAMHLDFNAFAKQQQLNHEQNRKDAAEAQMRAEAETKEARDFRRKLVIASIPLIPTIIGGITWLVWRSIVIFEVHHL